MEPKFSKLESKVNLLLQANTPISTIATILEKSSKSIYNALNRIKKKKQEDSNIERVRKGRVEKITPREKRIINRDLIISPKKENKRLLLENNLGVTKRSLQRLLRDEYYSSNVATKKPLLNKKKTADRLLDTREKDENIRRINLSKIVFSDKAAIQRGHRS
jgi:transposase